MRFIKFLMLAAAIAMFAACGGGSGGSAGGDGSGTEFKTKVELTDDAAGDLYAAGRAGEIMTVTLILSNGDDCIMDSLGNNEYSCTIEDYDGSAGYIEAVLGQVVMKNFFKTATVDTSVNLGRTNPITTLYVDVIQAYVGASSGGVKATVEEMFAGSADIDVEAVQEQVATSDDFEALRSQYTQVLSYGHVDYDVASVMENALSNDMFIDILAGTVEAPVVETPETPDTPATADVVKAVAMKLIETYTAGSVAPMSAAVDADTFLDSGMDIDAFVSEYTQAFTELAQTGLSIRYTEENIRVFQPDTSVDSYNVFYIGRFQVVDGDGNVVSEHMENERLNPLDRATPAKIVKIDGEWKLIGDQLKAEYSYSMKFDGKNIRFSLGAYEIDDYPIDSAVYRTQTISNTALTEQFSEEDGIEYRMSVDSDAFCGQAVTIQINYVGGSSESVSFDVPSCPENPALPEITSVTKQTNGDVTVGFDISNIQDKAFVYLEVGDYEAHEMPFNSSSVTIPASAFSGAGTYEVFLSVEDIYGRDFIATEEINY